MSETIIKTLKLKLVAAELARIGITDRQTVVAIAERTTVDDTGAIIGLTADGTRGVGSAPNYELSIADIARDMGVTGTDQAAAIPGKADHSAENNPFAKGPSWSITGQMVLLKTDPDRAEYLQHIASVRG